MRILFMGTPDFAAVSLKRLVEDGHEICGVFTQPDKPRNRNKVTFSPVKEYALSCGLTVYQPVKMRDGTALDIVKSLAPELIVVVAYGRILPKDILDVPPLGCVNVHASLLPKYRGAAPINWAMLNGDAETGVSIMYMAEELDAGDVIRVAKTPILRFPPRRGGRTVGDQPSRLAWENSHSSQMCENSSSPRTASGLRKSGSKTTLAFSASTSPLWRGIPNLDGKSLWMRAMIFIGTVSMGSPPDRHLFRAPGPLLPLL